MSAPFEMDDIFKISLKDAREAIDSLDKEAFADFIEQITKSAVDRMFKYIANITERYTLVYNITFNLTVVDKFDR